ncbi:hypothetical protein [Fluviicola sp.]|uniref:hypothetical protein n=1 Tax=Fluviicola sp. TaxID=1917219 RepID=UPI0031DA1B32
MKHILTACILLLCLSSFGQLKLEGSLEFDSQGDVTVKSVYPLGKRGFLALALSNESEEQKYQLISFSANLQEETTVEFTMNKRTKNHGMLVNQDSTEFSFLYASRSSWFVKTFSTERQELTEKEFKKQNASFVPLNFLVLKDKIIMNGLLHRRPRLLTLDIRTGQEELLEIPEIKAVGSIESITLDENKERAVIFFRRGKDQKTSAMNLVFLDENGVFSSPLTLEKDSEFSIIDGQVTWINNESFLLAGTYGLGHLSKMAAGYYFSKWENNVQQFITYHSFTEFRDFTKYLPTRQVKSIQKKSKRSNASDYVENMVELHPVYLTDFGYRMIGEVYVPTYRYETRTYMSSNGRMSTRTVRVFDGFEYTHAAILDLDEKGEKINDFCFILNLEIKPYKPIRNLRVYDDAAGDMKMVYAQNHSLVMNEIVGNEVETTEIGGIRADMDVEGRSTNFVRCVYWFGNTYMIYGVQTVLSDDESDHSRRAKKNRPTVFFVKKMSYND